MDEQKLADSPSRQKSEVWSFATRNYVSLLTFLLGVFVAVAGGALAKWWIGCFASWILLLSGAVIATYEIHRSKDHTSSIHGVSNGKASIHSPLIKTLLTFVVVAGLIPCIWLSVMAYVEHRDALGRVEDVEVLGGGTNVQIIGTNGLVKSMAARAMITQPRDAPSQWIGNAHVIKFTVFPNTEDSAITLSSIRVKVIGYEPIPQHSSIATIFPQSENVYWVDIAPPTDGMDEFRATWFIEKEEGPNRLKQFAPFDLGKKGEEEATTFYLRVNATKPGLYRFRVFVDLQGKTERRKVEAIPNSDREKGSTQPFDCLYLTSD